MFDELIVLLLGRFAEGLVNPIVVDRVGKPVAEASLWQLMKENPCVNDHLLSGRSFVFPATDQKIETERAKLKLSFRMFQRVLF